MVGEPLSSGGTIPTEYLSQLPANWPYTEYGIARKAGKTTSWPLVAPNATTQTVAWVYHSVLWNPRPLFTPAAEKSRSNGEEPTLYNPLLKDWTHSFIYETITPPASDVVSTSTTQRSPTISAPSGKPSTTAKSGFLPTIAQSSVLSKDTDNDSEIRRSMLSSSSAMSSKTQAIGADVNPMPTAAPTDPSALSELWEEVRSMKSRLGA